MSKSSANALMFAALIFVGAAILYSDPRCGRGCRTVLQHIMDHELGDILGMLGA